MEYLVSYIAIYCKSVMRNTSFPSPVISGTTTSTASTAITTSVSCDDSCDKLSASAVRTAAGISVVVTLVVAVPVGVVLGFCGTLCLRRRRRASSEGDKREEVYEEPVAVAPVETVFSLSDNQAYGKINIHNC